MSQQTVAVQNALSGERTHRTFSIPITGDEELDFMSALMSIANEMIGAGPNSPPHTEPCRRVLQWFFKRTQAIHQLPVTVIQPQIGQGLAGMLQPQYQQPLCSPNYSQNPYELSPLDYFKQMSKTENTP